MQEAQDWHAVHRWTGALWQVDTLLLTGPAMHLAWLVLEHWMARETHCEQTAWSCGAGRSLGVTGKACRTHSAVGQTPLQARDLSVSHIGEMLASVCSHYVAARPACHACAGRLQAVCRKAQRLQWQHHGTAKRAAGHPLPKDLVGKWACTAMSDPYQQASVRCG